MAENDKLENMHILLHYTRICMEGKSWEH